MNNARVHPREFSKSPMLLSRVHTRSLNRACVFEFSRETKKLPPSPPSPPVPFSPAFSNGTISLDTFEKGKIVKYPAGSVYRVTGGGRNA